MANKVKVEIAGNTYTINTEETEGYIQSISDEINGRINKLLKENPNLTPTMVASITALQFCDEAKKRRLECEDLKVKAMSAAEGEATAKLQLSEAMREIERITLENRALRTKMEPR